ncbi:uncharacterized protein OCT59_007840 [Rhizophagus irregularis]|uniref:uncharacterized protein n=1 Tax=Rhizophagus irregularis TaxID=588596 RepID=UPI000CAEE7DC|nr:hypothetical protein OCT59_007840 [Rhizophagus irregularis]GBC14456.1 GATA-binding factor 2-like [Rhizophagus irregularis DAOM 181602=DAOM 197198]CAG8530443.1 13018_t:CDS:2 [Rhizophagus irregularis]
MTQNYLQEYQSQHHQENDIFTYNFTQNGYSHENAYTDSQLFQLLQLNTITHSTEPNPLDKNIITDDSSKSKCADCLTTSAPRWRVRQDGEKVCNACGLYRRKHGSKRPLEMLKECNTINLLNQPEICISCGINESNGEGYCNACGLYAVFNFLNSGDENMNVINSLDHINNNLTTLNEENINMDQTSYFQDYQNQFSTTYQENDITTYDFMQNYEKNNNENNTQVDPKQLQLTYFNAENSLNDDNIMDDFSCADCLATSAQVWEILQDGKKLCSECVSYRKKYGSKRQLEMTRKNSALNIFIDPDQPEICVNCGINKSVEGGHCNACKLYAVFDSSSSGDETNTPDYTSYGMINQSKQGKIVNMDQPNYFQEYQNQNSSSYQENDFNSNNYKQQNHFIETDLQFNATNNYEANITDASLKITCADCLTTTSPRWRVRQDGEKVCNACGLYRRKHGSKRPFEMTREYNTRTIFANQPKICVYCESSGEKHCNACGLYATLGFLNSKDEKMGVKNTQPNHNENDMDQPNFLQGYQSQYFISYQENNNSIYNYIQNDYSLENTCAELQKLQLNTSTYSTGQYSLNDKSDNNKKILCADCLTTSAPMWRIRQDGQRVCNACGLHRRKYGRKRPLEIMRECKNRVRRRTIFTDPESCANCGTTESTNWRIIGGRRYCNACGLCAIINRRPPRSSKSTKK